MARQAKVTKIFTFEAAHSLPNHSGQCRNPHGHSYKCEVTCCGAVHEEEGASDEGMVIDFAEMKKIWNSVIQPMVDHQDLNKTLPVTTTTAENIALWINQTLRQWKLPIYEIRLWETATSYVTINSL